MHDEVSETENIRKNLAIERMIVEGCEVLLDTSQTFVRQGEEDYMESTGSFVHAQQIHQKMMCLKTRSFMQKCLVFFNQGGRVSTHGRFT